MFKQIPGRRRRLWLLLPAAAVVFLAIQLLTPPDAQAAWWPGSAKDKEKDKPEFAFISTVFEEVSPAVVYISSITQVAGENGEKELRVGSGSGVICSEEGYIITNHHVIDQAQEIEVALADGRSTSGKVVAAAPSGDLALLKIDLPDLTVAKLGDSSKVAVGDLVFPIGNPGGAQFARSMTMGIISGLDRQIVLSDGNLYSLLQTDAAINPGNSGGPLVNTSGKVVGISSVKIVDAEFEGMGFAIPINTVISILSELQPELFPADSGK